MTVVSSGTGFVGREREAREVVELVAEGLSNRAIAERLVLSERTAQGHVQNSIDKLHATSRAAIATWYVREARPDQARPRNPRSLDGPDAVTLAL